MFHSLQGRKDLFDSLFRRRERKDVSKDLLEYRIPETIGPVI